MKRLLIPLLVFITLPALWLVLKAAGISYLQNETFGHFLSDYKWFAAGFVLLIVVWYVVTKRK
jgi:uncharacterized membrane protein YoaT (DUF817 family)